MDVSIKKFNKTINSSMDISEKFNAWNGFRKDVCKIIKELKKIKPEIKDIMIFGAGECNDLHLDLLSQHFDKIVLTDIDKNSMKKGLEYQKIENDKIKKIIIEEVEYTGFEEIQFFEKLFYMIKQGKKYDEVMSYINSAAQEVNIDNILAKYRECFEFVLVSPIYTQLIFTQVNVIMNMLNTYKLYSDEEISDLRNKVIEIMPFVIKNFNKLVLSVLNEEGYIAVLTDVIEDNPKSELMGKILGSINNESIIDCEYNKYLNKHGFGLGSYGLHDIKKYFKELYSFWTVWPFNDERYFLVKAFIGRRSK